MSADLHILGDGWAGLMLARRLRREGWNIRLYGRGRSNMPPWGLVHLHAGRSFRRSALELEAFARAVDFWRAEPLASERRVRRWLEPSGRLARSLHQAELPSDWSPCNQGDGWVEYGPGFVIAAQALEARWREELRPHFEAAEIRPNSPWKPRCLALGAGVVEWLPQAGWDLSTGRTMEAWSPTPRDTIVIGQGVHLAPHPDGRSVTLGGRSSATGAWPEDELELANALTGDTYQAAGVWTGQRCAVARDHRPALGWVDQDTFAFCGFGSRALFWLPWCLELAVQALQGGVLPDELAVGRLLG